jgi:hypothetical protein
LFFADDVALAGATSRLTDARAQLELIRDAAMAFVTWATELQTTYLEDTGAFFGDPSQRVRAARTCLAQKI